MTSQGCRFVWGVYEWGLQSQKHAHVYDVFGVSWKDVDPHSAHSGIDPALGEALAPVWHHFTGALRVPDGVISFHRSFYGSPRFVYFANLMI